MNVAIAFRLRTWNFERVGFAAGAAATGALAAAACLPGALRFALWQDEVASARVIAAPQPVALLRHVAHSESTPPLWYALAWLVHRCGVGIVDVRLLSVAAAALLASMTAVAARRIVRWPSALLAGAAVALGYQFDFHGRELRAYELAALLTVALAIAAARGGIVLAAVVAAGSLTHYFFLFSVVAVVFWRPRLWRPVVVGLIPLALGAGAGYLLGVSAVGYLVMGLVVAVGGFLSGFEHRDGWGGADRGLVAGAIYGWALLMTHALIGGRAKVSLGSFPPLLIVITAIIGSCLAAAGGRIARARRESATAQQRSPADLPTA